MKAGRSAEVLPQTGRLNAAHGQAVWPIFPFQPLPGLLFNLPGCFDETVAPEFQWPPCVRLGNGVTESPFKAPPSTAPSSMVLHVPVAAEAFEPAFLGGAAHLLHEHALDLVADLVERLDAGEAAVLGVEHEGALG